MRSTLVGGSWRGTSPVWPLLVIGLAGCASGDRDVGVDRIRTAGAEVADAAADLGPLVLAIVAVLVIVGAVRAAVAIARNRAAARRFALEREALAGVDQLLTASGQRPSLTDLVLPVDDILDVRTHAERIQDTLVRLAADADPDDRELALQLAAAASALAATTIARAQPRAGDTYDLDVRLREQRERVRVARQRFTRRAN